VKLLLASDWLLLRDALDDTLLRILSVLLDALLTFDVWLLLLDRELSEVCLALTTVLGLLLWTVVLVGLLLELVEVLLDLLVEVVVLVGLLVEVVLDLLLELVLLVLVELVLDVVTTSGVVLVVPVVLTENGFVVVTLMVDFLFAISHLSSSRNSFIKTHLVDVTVLDTVDTLTIFEGVEGLTVLFTVLVAILRSD
jgi:hypothetical protein